MQKPEVERVVRQYQRTTLVLVRIHDRVPEARALRLDPLLHVRVGRVEILLTGYSLAINLEITRGYSINEL